MSINITENVCDDGTISCRHSLGHQTLETHPQKDGHDDDDDDDDGKDDGDNDEDSDDDDDDDGSKGADWSGDGNQNCCDNLATGCVILDNDPRVHYVGPWVLKATESSTSHNTVVEGSTVSLIFNGKFYQCPLRDPDTQMTLQVALSLYLAQSLQAISPSRRRLHTTLIHCLPLLRYYPKQPMIFLTSRFILLLICHRTKNTDSLSMSLKPNRRHRMFWLAFPFPPYPVPTAANPLRLLLHRLQYLQVLQLYQTIKPLSLLQGYWALWYSSLLWQFSSSWFYATYGVKGSILKIHQVSGITFRVHGARVHYLINMHTIETVYSAFTTTESILRNDSNIWSQAPSPFSFNETSSQIPRPSRFLWSTGSDFSWPSDFAQPREATGRLSVMKFALPPHSKSLSTSPSILENN